MSLHDSKEMGLTGFCIVTRQSFPLYVTKSSHWSGATTMSETSNPSRLLFRLSLPHGTSFPLSESLRCSTFPATVTPFGDREAEIPPAIPLCLLEDVTVVDLNPEEEEEDNDDEEDDEDDAVSDDEDDTRLWSG